MNPPPRKSPAKQQSDGSFSAPDHDQPESADSTISLSLEMPLELAGQRVDSALTQLLTEYSRAAIQNWMRQGNVRIGDKALKPRERLHGGEQLEIVIPPVEPSEWVAQDIALDIVFSDTHLFVINKPAGLVVHPGAGNPDQTLLNGLLHLDPGLRLLPRAGIVHRLDKDTSGLMVVARSEMARQSLIDQLSQRSVSRRYLAVSNGVPVTGETIDQPIGRHRVDRLRMAVTDNGKPAITHIRVAEKFRAHALLEARLETGRTHQIRVHLAWRGYPLCGDPVYGSRARLPAAASDELVAALRQFRRQALHATALSLVHPASGETMHWQQDMPDDMQQLVNLLQKDYQTHSAR